MESFYDTLQAYRYLVGLEVVENEDVPTVYVGPGNILVAAHVVFDGGLATAEIDECISAMEEDRRDPDLVQAAAGGAGSRRSVLPDAPGDQDVNVGDPRVGAVEDRDAQDETDDDRDDAAVGFRLDSGNDEAGEAGGEHDARGPAQGGVHRALGGVPPNEDQEGPGEVEERDPAPATSPCITGSEPATSTNSRCISLATGGISTPPPASRCDAYSNLAELPSEVYL